MDVFIKYEIKLLFRDSTSTQTSDYSQLLAAKWYSKFKDNKHWNSENFLQKLAFKGFVSLHSGCNCVSQRYIVTCLSMTSGCSCLQTFWTQGRQVSAKHVYQFEVSWQGNGFVFFQPMTIDAPQMATNSAFACKEAKHVFVDMRPRTAPALP